MRFDEWPDILPLLQSAIINVPYVQRGKIAPMTSFLDREPTPTIGTFYRTSKCRTVTLNSFQRERTLNLRSLVGCVEELHPDIHEKLTRQRKAGRRKKSKVACRTSMSATTYLRNAPTFIPERNLPCAGAGHAVSRKLSATTYTP